MSVKNFEPQFMKLGVLTAALQELTPRAVRDPDPDRAIDTLPEVLRRWYGLTQAESRLAQLLVQGMSVPMAARQLKISTHTARSQSKSIFDKTGARRQSELVRLLLQGPGLLRP